MRHVFSVRIGPIGFRIGSDWRTPIDQLAGLYRDYPAPHDGVPDYTVRLFAARPWRRFVRPSVMIGGDFVLPEAAPLPLAQGLLAAEMGMNLQMALGQRRYLLLHASVVERDGRALLMTGVSGSGKSTLAALLGARGWRLMGDEFALLDPATGLVHPFPRLISLKNQAIAVAEQAVPHGRFGPLMEGTPKGSIRHLVPGVDAIAAMETPAMPALLLFPSFGFDAATRDVAQSEVFVRLTQASTNYVAMGERGFTALTRLVKSIPAHAIDYLDTDSALAQVEAAWADLGSDLGGAMNDGWLLARALCTPGDTLALDAAGWTDLLAIARAEQMIGTLAHRLAGLPVPKSVARILDDARASAEQGRIIALWEAEMARRVLTAIGVPLVLLKGTAFVAAGLEAGQGRSIGDLDILVPRDRIDAVEAALLAGGWEWVKPDPYDDDYYRRWMHELPPLIHRERDRMIDVHHTILPLTARITPDAGALLAARVALQPGVHGLSPNDMLVHAAAHLFADGDLAGGMRNLWDVHCLVGDFGTDGLAERAAQHGLARETARALRLAAALYGARVRLNLADRLYLRRLTARDGWGWPTRPFTRFGFYVRSHWLRMPPAMLARHLWTKWRKGGAGPASG